MPDDTAAAVNALLNSISLLVLLAIYRWFVHHREGRKRERDEDR